MRERLSERLSEILAEILDGYLLLHQVAEELGVSRMTLWRWVKLGRLPVYRIGREVLVAKHVVAEIKARGAVCVKP